MLRFTVKPLARDACRKGNLATLRGMRLILDVDLDALDGDASAEVGRILRYWAGAAAQLPLDKSVSHDLMDSQYRPVGTFRIEWPQSTASPDV